MDLALLEAQKAERMKEIPVGAVLVFEDRVIASTGNEILLRNDPTAHAEMIVIQKGSALLKTPRLEQCDLYVTLEPCPMCAQAIAFARIRRLYFGAYDPKGGGVEHGPQIFSQATCHHRIEIFGGLKETECGQILKNFFQERR